MRQRFLFVTLVTIASCTVGTPAAHTGAAEQPPPASPPGPTQRAGAGKPLAQLSELVIPADLGQVSQVVEGPAAGPAAKRLILIEDAHVNYEAQKHLAGILDGLVSRHGIALVLVEGGAGDVGLSRLRRFGSPDTREALADEWLKAGELSGEEYLDVVSDHALTLWGVDDMALYEQQFQAFVEVERARKEAGPPLAAARGLIERLRARSPNEPLRAFEADTAAFEAGTMDFSAYAESLRRESARLGVSLEPYPHLQVLVEADRMEPSLDREAVSREQRQALEQARPRVPDASWERLAQVADRLKAGDATSAAYYQALESLLAEAGVDLTAFPALTAYLRYYSLRAQAAGRTWWQELHQAQRELRERLIASPQERELVTLADRVARCERLLRLEWVSDDLEAVRRQPEEVRPSAWWPALGVLAAAAGLSAPAGDAAMLDGALERAQRFYDISETRDEALIQRALERMDATGERTAVLIAGGFHTGRLVERLTAQGAQVAVVTPWAGADDEPSRYATILKTKYEHRLTNNHQVDADFR